MSLFLKRVCVSLRIHLFSSFHAIGFQQHEDYCDDRERRYQNPISKEEILWLVVNSPSLLVLETVGVVEKQSTQ